MIHVTLVTSCLVRSTISSSHRPTKLDLTVELCRVGRCDLAIIGDVDGSLSGLVTPVSTNKSWSLAA